jgi:hypothetical protein
VAGYMAMKKYYVHRYGDLFLETSSFEEFKDWIRKNNQRAALFNFSTSDADCSYTSDGFDKIVESQSNGFTEEESLDLEEQFGILV